MSVIKDFTNDGECAYKVMSLNMIDHTLRAHMYTHDIYCEISNTSIGNGLILLIL